MARLLVLFIVLGMPDFGVAQPGSDPQIANGRRPVVPEMFLRTGEAVSLCLERSAPWVDFCNGLMQGYAEYAVTTGKACIPAGISRRKLVETFTGPDVVLTTGYMDNLPALQTAVEMFIRHYPCE